MRNIAQIKDVVYAAGGGAVAGFTLSGRGLFSGPLKQALPWASVIALGANAVMVADASALQPTQRLLDDASGSSGGSGGNILGSQVLTDSGIDLGVVGDVIVEVDREPAQQCVVVGYEIESSEARGGRGTKVLIPLPDTLAASGEHLMVPAAARDFAAQDMAGFGAAVLAFRAELDGARR